MPRKDNMKRLELLLGPANAAMLAELVAAWGISQSAAVRRLILDAYALHSARRVAEIAHEGAKRSAAKHEEVAP